MTTKFSRFCVSALVLVAAGCGGEKLPETVSITGTVKYKDKPVEAAQVVLNSTDPKGKPATGVTDAQGNFGLQTFVSATAQAKGAMPGNYKVTVTKVEQSTMTSEEMMKASTGGKPVGPKQLLPEKYASVTTTDLVVEVKKGSNAPLPLDLKD